VAPEQRTTTIYVALLDEGTDCWRPVEATDLGDSIFRIADQEIPEDEVWEFRPGEIVRCHEHAFADGRHLRAFARA
jgi:hypothetical protein